MIFTLKKTILISDNMKIRQIDIGIQVIEFLRELIGIASSFQMVNQKIEKDFGVASFLDHQEDYLELKNEIADYPTSVRSQDPIEYGDFQTPSRLTDQICSLLSERQIAPGLLIEPTCGKGNFVISSLRHFDSIKKIIGIEIYKPYIWECKLKIIDFYLKNPSVYKLSIEIFHHSIFDFNFQNLKSQFEGKEVLVLGNPPWVTNSKLGSLNSKNLPLKSNFKNYTGLDAITGKGNFDIAEYITLTMLSHFSNIDGHLTLLIKNSVIKNIVYDQRRNNYRIGDLLKLNIDSKREFNAAVDASLFYCSLNRDPLYQCLEQDFYQKSARQKFFGWFDDKFVSTIKDYQKYKSFDGVSPLEWRSGIKHDCASALELRRSGSHWINKRQQKAKLEENLIFEFLKSSDLRHNIITHSSKYLILTQRRIGEDTAYIKEKYPLTYDYLSGNIDLFKKRKSGIYKDRPRFSIFGVGDYTFKQYKVAISGLYKEPKFCLIIPKNPKPILLDDTCYFLGFDDPNEAIYTFLLLNSKSVLDFLKSLVFPDSKRVYTKEILMRMDLVNISKAVPFEEVRKDVETMPPEWQIEITKKSCHEYLMNLLTAEGSYRQMSLF